MTQIHSTNEVTIRERPIMIYEMPEGEYDEECVMRYCQPPEGDLGHFSKRKSIFKNGY